MIPRVYAHLIDDRREISKEGGENKVFKKQYRDMSEKAMAPHSSTLA